MGYCGYDMRGSDDAMDAEDDLAAEYKSEKVYQKDPLRFVTDIYCWLNKDGEQDATNAFVLGAANWILNRKKLRPFITEELHKMVLDIIAEEEGENELSKWVAPFGTPGSGAKDRMEALNAFRKKWEKIVPVKRWLCDQCRHPDHKGICDCLPRKKRVVATEPLPKKPEKTMKIRFLKDFQGVSEEHGCFHHNKKDVSFKAGDILKITEIKDGKLDIWHGTNLRRIYVPADFYEIES